MWGEKHSEAVDIAFKALNTHNIQWMVLRNYEGLPHKNRSKDIDLLMRKKDFKNVENILIESLKLKGFSRLKKEVFQYVWCLTFFKILEEEIISIKIDLLDGFVWKGAQLMHFNTLNQNRVAYNNFYVPNIVEDGFMLWMKPLLTGGFIKEKYVDDIIDTIDKYPKEFKALLISTFGKKTAEKAWIYLKNKELNKTIHLQKKLSYSAWLQECKKYPIKTVYSTIEHYYKEIVRRSIRPKGSFISVTNLDDIRESTFIEIFEKELAKYFIKDNQNIQTTYFNMEKPVNSLIDYTWKYWFKIHYKCSNGYIHIIDLAKLIKPIYWYLIPNPDLIFIFKLENNTISKKFLKGSKKIIIINTPSDKIEKTCLDAIKEVITISSNPI